MHNPLLIGTFVVVIVLMLLLDLGIVNKSAKNVGNKQAALWTLIWVSLAMLFSVFVYFQLGEEKFAQFQSAYWIEEALSVDNLFVFILVFSYFKLEGKLQHKVLFWGIMGAFIFRAIFIFSGIGLINLTYLPSIQLGGWNFNLSHTEIEKISWATKQFTQINVILSIFGFFLVYAGIKSFFASDDDEKQDFNQSFGARMLRKFLPVSNDFHEDKFFIHVNGKKIATRLLLVLVVIETTDLIFAVDSIPAIFTVAPDDPFILYTSNIFAILGLRSMYFLLANSINLFSKLKYGLAIILSFIGVKMLISPVYHFDTKLSLFIVLGLLVGSVLLSVLTRKRN